MGANHAKPGYQYLGLLPDSNYEPINFNPGTSILPGFCRQFPRCSSFSFFRLSIDFDGTVRFESTVFSFVRSHFHTPDSTPISSFPRRNFDSVFQKPQTLTLETPIIMASRKKQSEGIALLSMYSDEDDEEMEELGEGDAEVQRREQEQQPEGSGGDNPESNHMEEDSTNDAMVTDECGGGGEQTDVARQLQRVEVSFTSSSTSLRAGRVVSSKKSVRGSVTIVDYGHDEVAMSPEPEDAIPEHTSPGTSQAIATPQPTDHMEQAQSDDVNNSISESEDVKVEESTAPPEGKTDLLDKFLPPPPKEKCSSELQNKISKFISLKKVGRSFNAEVRNRKDYRNPDFLQHAVNYQGIDHIGSCFSKDVFDPHGYDMSDFYNEIEADFRRDRERREQELKRSPKVEFVPGGTQPGMVVPQSIFSMPIPVAASGLPPAPVPAETGSRDGRQNKKSKWDKVDGDGRNPLPVGSQDSLATAAAAHAALLSATNAGAGYPAFVQQKRREAEERRSGERRTDRRS